MLALVFVREVGAIDNITYRQLNSDINNQRASLDLHYLCTKGLLEQKGQSRSTYYIAGEKFVNSRDGESLNSRVDEENSRANILDSRANKPLDSRAKEALNSRGCVLNSRANEPLNSKAKHFSKGLEERIAKIGRRSQPEEMKELIIELCRLEPMSLIELASVLKRRSSSLRYLYINSLIKNHQLFYTIPEMRNHPDQKYTSKK